VASGRSSEKPQGAAGRTREAHRHTFYDFAGEPHDEWCRCVRGKDHDDDDLPDTPPENVEGTP
jgi:hypothetical protein